MSEPITTKTYCTKCTMETQQVLIFRQGKTEATVTAVQCLSCGKKLNLGNSSENNK